MAQRSILEYSEVPERASKIIESFIPPEDKIAERVKHFSHLQPRQPDQEGDTEKLEDVTFTHHFVDGPGDVEVVRWHYVQAGPDGGEAIVFLHGIPDSWYQWHHQISALARKGYRCIGVDLKGYGQSDKSIGDYRHEGVAEQLYDMLQLIGVNRFNLATDDRGTIQGDFITAKHPDAVLRYARGEQHLFHFHPMLAPQGELFADAPWSGMMNDTLRFVVWVYTWITVKPVPEHEMERVIQEFWYPGTIKAVPRYFNSSTFRHEWLRRRGVGDDQGLLKQWRCPIMIMLGYESKTQPREFYEKAGEYIPNAKSVDVTYMEGGHFWTLESPEETTAAIEELLKVEI